MGVGDAGISREPPRGKAFDSVPSALDITDARAPVRLDCSCSLCARDLCCAVVLVAIIALCDESASTAHTERKATDTNAYCTERAGITHIMGLKQLSHIERWAAAGFHWVKWCRAESEQVWHCHGHSPQTTDCTTPPQLHLRGHRRPFFQKLHAPRGNTVKYGVLWFYPLKISDLGANL